MDPGADPRLASGLLELQRAAYRLEADLIGDERIPGLHETLGALSSAPLVWTAVLDRTGRPVAAVAVEATTDALEVDRLVVSPPVLRRGLGAALVAAVLADAAAAGRDVTVSTGRENLPARRLYERLGFRHVEDGEPVPGLWVSRYRWRHGVYGSEDRQPCGGELLPDPLEKRR